MGNKLKFEFDFDEVFEGIKQGVIRELSEMEFDAARDSAIRQVKDEVKSEKHVKKQKTTEKIGRFLSVLGQNLPQNSVYFSAVTHKIWRFTVGLSRETEDYNDCLSVKKSYRKMVFYSLLFL